MQNYWEVMLATEDTMAKSMDGMVVLNGRPPAERAPLVHCIDDRSRQKDREHLI